MGGEILLVKMFQVGGVAVVSAIVDKGLESMEKPVLASLVKVVTFAGIGWIAVTAIADLMTEVARIFL